MVQEGTYIFFQDEACSNRVSGERRFSLKMRTCWFVFCENTFAKQISRKKILRKKFCVRRLFLNVSFLFRLLRCQMLALEARRQIYHSPLMKIQSVIFRHVQGVPKDYGNCLCEGFFFLNCYNCQPPQESCNPYIYRPPELRILFSRQFPCLLAHPIDESKKTTQKYQNMSI